MDCCHFRNDGLALLHTFFLLLLVPRELSRRSDKCLKPRTLVFGGRTRQFCAVLPIVSTSSPSCFVSSLNPVHTKVPHQATKIKLRFIFPGSTRRFAFHICPLPQKSKHSNEILITRCVGLMSPHDSRLKDVRPRCRDVRLRSS